MLFAAGRCRRRLGDLRDRRRRCPSRPPAPRVHRAGVDPRAARHPSVHRGAGLAVAPGPCTAGHRPARTLGVPADRLRRAARAHPRGRHRARADQAAQVDDGAVRVDRDRGRRGAARGDGSWPGGREARPVSPFLQHPPDRRIPGRRAVRRRRVRAALDVGLPARRYLRPRQPRRRRHHCQAHHFRVRLRLVRVGGRLQRCDHAALPLRQAPSAPRQGRRRQS